MSQLAETRLTQALIGAKRVLASSFASSIRLTCVTQLTLVDVNAFWEVGELFILSARDYVAANQPETFVASNLGLVLVVVRLLLILDEPVLNFWEVEASFPGAVRNIR